MNEQQQAKLLAQLLDGHQPLRYLQLEEGADWDQDDRADIESGILPTAARLAALPELLPPPDPAFEHRLWSHLAQLSVPAAQKRRDRSWWPFGRARSQPWIRGLAMVMAPVAAVLLFVFLVLPGPREALGNWMARFNLDTVDVVVAPEETTRPELAAATQSFADLATAADAAGFALLEPAYLPADFHLQRVETVSFEQLPTWLQPLYVEASYRPARPSPQIAYYAVLREFNTRRGDGSRLGELEFQSEAVDSVQNITLSNGQPAVLVEFEPTGSGEPVILRQLIWEHEGMTLELWSEVLPMEELLRIAASMRHLGDPGP